jgi:hypothetical protein
MSQILLFVTDKALPSGNQAGRNRRSHASPVRTMQERKARHPGGIAALGFAALGVVFGDIGTSPLYTLKTVLDLTGDGQPGDGARGPVPDRVDADRDHQHQIRHHRHAGRQ